jgi:hypothetical protein
MNRFWRIFAGVLVLTALVFTAVGRANVICIESSGRVSYGCNDVIPDEVSAGLARPVELGLSSQDCGFCHDYVVGQAVTQSFRDSALPVPVMEQHEAVFSRPVPALRNESQRVAVLDSSGSISPLKC